MKKKMNNKGFALVETLVCSLFVVAIFLILFENYIPLMAKYNRTEKYDDLDSKYISFYIKTFIESDRKDHIQLIHNKLYGKNIYQFRTINTPDPDIIAENNKPFELYTLLIKENKQKCQDFIEEASITSIYLVDYNTKQIKTKVSDLNVSSVNGVDISRPLQLYIESMPTYEATSETKSGYKRLIIEIKHVKKNENNENEVYYTYSNIELREAK